MPERRVASPRRLGSMWNMYGSPRLVCASSCATLRPVRPHGEVLFVPAEPTLLSVLLRRRHWQKYATFCTEYDRAARLVDPGLVGTWPSRAQLHRWLSGSLRGLPYPDYCRVLEKMFPGWPARTLFETSTDERVASAARPGQSLVFGEPEIPGAAREEIPSAAPLADVSAIFTSRSEFMSAMPPHTLMDGAKTVDVAGLSLNLLCQQYPDKKLSGLIEGGTRVRCLFLEPRGAATKAREREEGFAEGNLAVLTELNIQTLLKVRERLSPEIQERLQIATYDETVRFNITIVDNRRCVEVI